MGVDTSRVKPYDIVFNPEQLLEEFAQGIDHNDS